MNPRYPIYIISKGRWESRMTAKALELMNVPYNIVVEPQEFDEYAKVIEPEKILTLPFSNLGQGSIPARNWCWEDSMGRGFFRHWILDDNIIKFWRQNRNIRIQVGDGTIFRCAEDFTDRYENVDISGMNYYMFAPDRMKNPAFYLNTRVYSCILIRNDIPFRWRGKYNEDTDLSLRVLKSGRCTILFNAFLAQKMPTGTIKGGNMTELYGGNTETDQKSKEWIEKRRVMAQSLVDQHPDITTITWKWGRPQHQVYYGGFKRNKLKLRPGFIMPEGLDEYGMSVVEIEKEVIK